MVLNIARVYPYSYKLEENALIFIDMPIICGVHSKSENDYEKYDFLK